MLKVTSTSVYGKFWYESLKHPETNVDTNITIEKKYIFDIFNNIKFYSLVGKVIKITIRLIGVLIILFFLTESCTVKRHGKKRAPKNQIEGDEIKARLWEEAEVARLEGVKRKFELQTKKTQKRMKMNSRKAAHFNDRYKGNFIKRWFKHKKR
jgi:hypothetical protein